MNMNTRPSPAPQRAMKSRTSFVMSKKPCPRVSTTSVAALINSGAIAVIAESRFMTLFLLRHLSAGLQEFLWERGRGAAQRGSAFPLQVTLDIHRHLDETSEHPLHDGHDPLDFGVIGRRVIWPARPGRWCWRRGHWRRPRQNLWRGGQRRLAPTLPALTCRGRGRRQWNAVLQQRVLQERVVPLQPCNLAVKDCTLVAAGDATPIGPVLAARSDRAGKEVEPHESAIHAVKRKAGGAHIRRAPNLPSPA